MTMFPWDSIRFHELHNFHNPYSDWWLNTKTDDVYLLNDNRYCKRSIWTPWTIKIDEELIKTEPMVKVDAPHIFIIFFASFWRWHDLNLYKQILSCQSKSYTPRFVLKSKHSILLQASTHKPIPKKRNARELTESNHVVWWFFFRNACDSKIHFVSFDLVSSVIILWKIVFTWVEAHTHTAKSFDRRWLCQNAIATKN